MSIGFDAVTHEGITLDRCTHCQGLWCDGDEAQQLKDSPGAEVLAKGNRPI